MKKRILVTGAAGFIGFHLSLFLKDKGETIFGLDNFTPSYSPSLKKSRAKILKENGIPLFTKDICQTEELKKILSQERITHVIHLAAQAGVRRSITHAEEFVSSNLVGFVSLLEALRSQKEIFLLFASSSSVYGLNKKIPFSVEDPTNLPANLYGATKKADEVIAFSYHNLFKIPMRGFRFFTVYGPFGRPDMAYYLFTKKILSNEPIQIFNYGKMRRDFTYIDDIVEGLFSALSFEGGFEIFNLGNSHPSSLMEMVSLLENLLGKKAIKEMVPHQKGEVVETYADITKSQKAFGFSPKISLKEGLTNFVRWYKEYHTLSTNR